MSPNSAGQGTATRISIEPLRDQVVIAPLPAPAYEGRLIAVSLREDAAVRGTVVSVGPEVKDMAVGQNVVFSKLQGFEINGLILIPERAILATV